MQYPWAVRNAHCFW